MRIPTLTAGRAPARSPLVGSQRPSAPRGGLTPAVFNTVRAIATYRCERTADGLYVSCPGSPVGCGSASGEAKANAAAGNYLAQIAPNFTAPAGHTLAGMTYETVQRADPRYRECRRQETLNNTFNGVM